MHYYPHHIADYRSDTAHLSNEEDLAYRRLLEMYYDTEKPIPLETEWVARRLRVGTESVSTVLRDFFDETDAGWVHTRCERVISEYHGRAERARQNGKNGGRPRNPVGSESVASGPPEQTGLKANQKQNQKQNQEPELEPKPSLEMESDSISVLAPPPKARRRQQLPPDFYPNETGINAAGQKGINVAIELEKFRNYHQGKGSVMADWQAAWRTWVGNARPAMTQTRGKQLEPAWAEFYARSGPNVIDTEAKVIE